METTTGLNKQTFAAFIAAKRKAAGMTQEELARQLYVTHTTVSKWERGLSYPDIALVPEVCRLLGITEHEFFTACDDLQHRRQKRDAKHWRRLTLIGQGTLCGGYAVALLTCFICNLAVGHRLDWFFIVLTSLLLAFSLTSLPVFLKRERAVISLSAATGSLLLLILTCGLYTGGGWLGAGFSIVAACLGAALGAVRPVAVLPEAPAGAESGNTDRVDLWAAGGHLPGHGRGLAAAAGLPHHGLQLRLCVGGVRGGPVDAG